MKRNKLSCLDVILVIMVLGSCALGITFGLGYQLANHWADIGARWADPVRRIVGVQTVANMETVLFEVIDLAKQFKFKLGLETAAAPWQNLPSPTIVPTRAPTATPTDVLRVAYQTLKDTLPLTSASPTATPRPTLVPTITPTPSPTSWQLKPLMSFGTLPGEGQWTAYLQNMTGQAVAYRTFLQPDPDRPYTIVAVVAIDLSQTELQFVIGAEDISTAGKIAATDKVAGVLLATFNGGFKAEHGHYGAMADGVELRPPLDGLATIAMYDNGQVQLGEWGTDIVAADNLVSWRQNAKLVVQNGQVTDLAQKNSVADWHGTVSGEVITWRSGVGLSADGRILYYFAGPSMSMPVLGQAMVTAGADTGMLLDINPSWVDFTAIEFDGKKFYGVPLLEDGMSYAPNRFLSQYTRDFFYVTLKTR